MTLWGGWKVDRITRIGTRHEKSMKVADIGEFGLISRIAGLLPRHSAGVLVGIGDDVAVLQVSPPGGPARDLRYSGGRGTLLPFLDYSTPAGSEGGGHQRERHCCHGGVPAWALVSLALPQDTDVEFVEELYGGMQEQISEGGGAIVGGNTSAISCRMVIDLFLMGKAGSREGLFGVAEPGLGTWFS